MTRLREVDEKDPFAVGNKSKWPNRPTAKAMAAGMRYEGRGSNIIQRVPLWA